MTRRNIIIFLGLIAALTIGVLVCIWSLYSPSFFLRFTNTTALQDHFNREFIINRTKINEVYAYFGQKLVSGEYCSEPHASGSGLAVRCAVDSEWFQGLTDWGWKHYISFLFNADTEALLYITVHRVWTGF